MKLLKSSLLGSAAALVAAGGAYAADLPVRKAVPIEYVRICTAYGAGFFYIPGTDTCLRLSGRARLEAGYQPSYQRFGGNGDTTGYSTRLRINIDARTQTGYGTLRAFLRLETGSRTGGPFGGGTSGTQQRIGQAFAGTGVDSFGRLQQFVNTDKAFIQFAGFTAGRASSFFDFYAHDFEFAGATAGSDVASTNLLAYTATLGSGFSATLSLEDPTFRRSPIFSPYGAVNAAANATITGGALSSALGGISFQPIPVFNGFTGAAPTRFTVLDGIERNRMPDFVGALRYDAPWGSAQASAAVHELNVGNVAGGSVTTAGAAITGIAPGAGGGAGTITQVPHTKNDYGYAAQGGIKINAPFIAPGDAFYLQGAYGVGAQLYTGYSSYSGTYAQSASTINGQKFTQYFSDATINPLTGQFQKSESFSVVGSYLHYWTPEWRSAIFASYGEMNFSNASRNGQAAIYGVVNPAGTNSFGANAVGAIGSRFFGLSQALRDTYQIVAGASLIWSPVKDLDIGVEGFYTQIGVQRGRVIDTDKDPTAYSASRINAINAGGFVRTATQDSVEQIRIRVQRDF